MLSSSRPSFPYSHASDRRAAVNPSEPDRALAPREPGAHQRGQVRKLVARPDVETAVSNAKAGQVRYRTDKAGIIHCPIGRADFEVPALKENLETLLTDLKKAKPASAKGAYLKKLTVSSTMGPGVSVD